MRSTARRSPRLCAPRRRSVLLPWLLLCLVIARLPAQQPSPSSSPASDHPYTLHAYADLIQVPSLVLTPQQTSYRGLQASDFTLRLDRGPAFHPAHLRAEGADPLSLAILLDDGLNSDTTLLRNLAASAAPLNPGLFGSSDRLLVFALDCNLVRSVNDLATPAILQAGIRLALDHPELHHTRASPGKCQQRLGLWDALGAVASQLQRLPGRRVLLAITDGVDEGSHNDWDHIRQYASDGSIAIFGLQPPALDPSIGLAASRHGRLAYAASRGLLQQLSESTGGLAFQVTPTTLIPQLQGIVALLRDRYILEFPRPARSEAGVHRIEVRVADRNALVRTSGIAVPTTSVLLQDDPNNVPRDTSRLPVMGKAKLAASPR